MKKGYGDRLLFVVLAAQLTPLQREAFIDHAVLERSMEQVAADMGCSRANVGLLVGKARRRLARVDGIRELAA